MSFLNWFSDKSPQEKSTATNAQHCTHTGRDRPAASRPQRLAPERASHNDNGKLTRHARREQLYVAIREAMTRAGVLSASYKFKVLSLDRPGSRFLVMIDLVGASGGLPEQLDEIDALIVQNAKARFEITVSAVYWRRMELPADTGERKPREAAQKAALYGGEAVAAARAALKRPQAGATHPPHYEPIQADEMAAFKQALQAASPQDAAVATAQGVKTRSGLRYTLPAGFEETGRPLSGSPPVLSNTQYGELN